mmetsp:Transcript_29793/g.64930  ORF Transcript_29793/g.64930 Transcript_29793/m.64930 type:complete len:111 (+) Transcript_29793:250-582(+)
MKFMQTAQEEELRKRQAQEQLRHIEDMQWIVPGFEAEVQEAEAVKDGSSAESIGLPPPLRLYRRSYKGFNPVVEQWVKEQLRKHADALQTAEAQDQAAALRAMKQRRVRA